MNLNGYPRNTESYSMARFEIKPVKYYSANYNLFDVPKGLLWKEQTKENLDNLGWWYVTNNFNGKSVVLNPQQFLVFESTERWIQRVNYLCLSVESIDYQNAMKGLHWFADNCLMEYRVLFSSGLSGERVLRLAA